jgi:hypothetical protein
MKTKESMKAKEKELINRLKSPEGLKKLGECMSQFIWEQLHRPPLYMQIKNLKNTWSERVKRMKS